MIKWLKSRGFSDRLYFLNLTLSWLFVITCIVLTVLSDSLQINDLSIISYGLPAVFAELGIHTGLIVWKAKHENINKHRLDIFEEGNEIDELDDQEINEL